MPTAYRIALKKHRCVACGGTISKKAIYLDWGTRRKGNGQLRTCTQCVDAGRGPAGGLRTCTPSLAQPAQTVVNVTAEVHGALQRYAQSQGVSVAEICRQAMVQLRFDDLRVKVPKGRKHRLAVNFEQDTHDRIHSLAATWKCPRSHIIVLALHRYVERQERTRVLRRRHLGGGRAVA